MTAPGNEIDASGVGPVDDDTLSTRSTVETEAPPAPRITVEPHGAGSLVTLVGDIDAALRDQASLVMTEVIGRGGPVVVDLAAVRFIDSSGLAFVIQLHRLGVDDGLPCFVRNPPPSVVDLLELIGLLGEMTIEHTDGSGTPLPPADELAAADA